MKGRIRGELWGVLQRTLPVEPLKVRDGWKMSEGMMSLHSWDTVPPSGHGWAETSMEQMSPDRPGWCHEQGSGLDSGR